MIDTIIDTLSPFTLLDGIAFAFLIISAVLIGILVEHPVGRRSTHSLIADFHANWMIEMVVRDNRMLDTQVLASLRQGAALFMSASMIGIGGTLALLGSAETLQSLASDVSAELSVPKIVWEAKLMLVALFLVSAFLKFVWSHRLFGYCAVVLASVPVDPKNPQALNVAKKAAKLSTYAARSFNRGLRGVYFSLAALAWLIGPVALLLAVSVTFGFLYRREFHSQSRAALLLD